MTLCSIAFGALDAMTNLRLTLNETSGRWSVALRTAMVNKAVLITETMALSDAFGEFRDRPQSVLAFEASEESAEEGFGSLLASRQHHPGRAVVVLLDEAIAATEPLWYEAGAIAVVTSPRRLTAVARLIQRYFNAADTSPLTFRSSVIQRMPWSDAATRT